MSDLVICGMMSHMCVDTTVRAAKDYGFKSIILEDGCCTKNLEWNGKIFDAQTVHDIYMASLNGVFAEVVTVDEWIANNK